MDPTQFLFNDNEAKEAAKETVDYVYHEFLQTLQSMEKEAMAIPFASDLAIAKLREMIHLATFQFDGVVVFTSPSPSTSNSIATSSVAESSSGAGVAAAFIPALVRGAAASARLIAEPFEKMDADGEPLPSVIDSWARGTVSTRKVVNDPAAAAAAFRRNIPAASGTPSVSSYRSSATGRSRNTSSNRSYRSTHSKTTDRDDKTGKIIELDIDGEFGALGLNATGFMFDLLQKAVSL